MHKNKSFPWKLTTENKIIIIIVNIHSSLTAFPLTTEFGQHEAYFYFYVHGKDEASVLFMSIQVDVLLHGPSPSYHSVYSPFKGNSSSSVSGSSNLNVRPVLIVLFLSTKLDWTGGGFTDDDNTLPHIVVMWWPQKGGNGTCAGIIFYTHDKGNVEIKFTGTKYSRGEQNIILIINGVKIPFGKAIVVVFSEHLLTTTKTWIKSPKVCSLAAELMMTMTTTMI